MTVLRSTDAGVTLRYDCGQLTLAAVGEGRTHVELPGAVRPAQPGELDLPARVVRVGLPQSGNFRTSLKTGPARSFENIEPSVAVAVGFDDAPARQASITGVRDMLSVGAVEEIRGVRFVELILRPCRYDAASRRLEVSEWMELTVEFEGRPTVEPGNDPFSGIVAGMLVNGVQAVDWKSPPADGGGSFFNRSAHWVKLGVSRTGIHGVTGRELAEAGVPLAGIETRSLALYTLGEHQLNGPYPDTMVPVALRVEDEGDGRLDPDDRVVFFGQAADHWVNRCSTWVANPYTAQTAYWLTWGLEPGLRIATGLGPDTTGAPLVGVARWRVHQEENQECPARSGLLWVWRTIMKDSYRPSVGYDVALEAATPVRLDSLRGRLFSTTGANEVVLFLNGAPLDTLRFDQAQANQPFRFATAPAAPLSTRDNKLTLDVRGEGSHQVMLDYLEFDLTRRLSLHEGQCRFLADDTGAVRFLVRDTDGPVIALDVTNPLRPMAADGIVYRDGSAEFARVVARPSEFCVAPARGLLKPDFVELRRPGRLAAPGYLADHWIVAPDEFRPAAERLARYRTGGIAWLPGARSEVAVLGDIVDDYAYGIREPGAIKRFLADKRPLYALLAGDATYDYRNYLGLATGPGIPAYEVGMSLDPSGISSRDAYAFDAWYADWEGQGGSPDVMLGRVTCRTPGELGGFVDKLIAYETGPAGAWSRRFILLADDEWSGDPNRPDPIGFKHIEQCEGMAVLPGSRLDPVKVYLTEHPFAGVKNKPGARAELVRELATGALVWVFFGHGDAFDLCHESAFNISVVADVTCGSRTPVCYFGSCSVGRFEDTRYDCIAEELVRKADGGAIATIGATKATTSGSNSVFARNLLVPLFQSPDSTIGMAFFQAWPTDRLYHLFGDPATRLQMPGEWPEPLVVSPDTLRPAEAFRARALLGETEGHCQWRLAGPWRMRTYTSSRGTSVYTLPGVTLARGNVAVRSGRLHLDGRFPLGVALDTVRVANGSYVPVPRSCRLSAVVSGTGPGFGILRDTLAWSADAAAVSDSVGPSVRFSSEGRELTDGAVVPADFELDCEVRDPSGILIAPVPGWTPTFFTGRREETVDLAERLVFDDSSTTTARFRLPVRLTTCDDTLWVQVSDNLLNRAIAGVAVRSLAATEPLRVDSVRVYPNPLRDNAWFAFELNRPATVTVRVYTLSGRLVRDLGDRPAGFGYNQLDWDGRDGEGNRPANGVYLFTLTARAQGVAGSETVRVRDRLLVLR